MSAYRMKKAFTVVKADYNNIKGQNVSGLFLIIYNEAMDDTISYVKNVVGFKLTTRAAFMNRYYYRLKKKHNAFLHEDSWVQCSRPYVLDIDKCEYLGTIAFSASMGIYKRLKEFLKEADVQCFSVLDPNKEEY